MRNFNLNSITRGINNSQFSISQEEYFENCYLETLLQRDTISTEGMSGGVIAGIIAGLIGLIWGVYKLFFGDKSSGGGGGGGAVSAAITRYETNFSSSGAKSWDKSWETVSKTPPTQKQSQSADKENKIVYSKDLVEALKANVRFRSLVNSNIFRMDFRNRGRYCENIVKASSILADAIEELVSILDKANSNNLSDMNSKFNSLDSSLNSKIISISKEITKIAEIQFTNSDSLKGSMYDIDNANGKIRNGSGNNISDSEFDTICEETVRAGAATLSTLMADINSIKDIEANVSRAERTALNTLERYKRRGSDEADNLVEFQKEVLDLLRAVTNTVTSNLRYLVFDLDERSNYIEILKKELTKK